VKFVELSFARLIFDLIAVHVEWSKAKAWKDRWVKEVLVLREEVKRVLRMLRTIQGEWSARARQRSGIDAQLAGGLKAYALRQVHVHRAIAEVFHSGWGHSVASAVRQVVERDGSVHNELLDGNGVDKAPLPTQHELGQRRSVSPEGHESDMEQDGPAARWATRASGRIGKARESDTVQDGQAASGVRQASRRNGKAREGGG
jgi:hypothetical protein